MWGWRGGGAREMPRRLASPYRYLDFSMYCVAHLFFEMLYLFRFVFIRFQLPLMVFISVQCFC